MEAEGLIVRSEREQIEEQAAHWVTREDRGLDLKERAALERWVSQSTSHRLAYLRLKAGWQRTAKMGALRSGIAIIEKVQWLKPALIAAAVLIAVASSGGIVWHFQAHTPKTFVARKGERPVLKLSDGTRIQLNTNTRVQTKVTRSSRTVTLEQGEAYFEVIHDDKRPFVVYAGNRRITDLGTKFSVRRNGDDVKVIVTEGKVRVDILDAPEAATPVFATTGSVVVAKAEETLVATKSLKEIDDDLSWRVGMLTFDQETLASAAEQFNHYNDRTIVVRGAAREIRIGGSFRADNAEVFAGLVKNALGLKVTQEKDRIIIGE